MRTADTGALDVTTEATNTGWLPRQDKLGNHHSKTFFFHEFGRRVGMVPRSSLKGGKVSRMVEKITRTQQKTSKQKEKPTGRVSTIM